MDIPPTLTKIAVIMADCRANRSTHDLRIMIGGVQLVTVLASTNTTAIQMAKMAKPMWAV